MKTKDIIAELQVLIVKACACNTCKTLRKVIRSLKAQYEKDSKNIRK